MSKLQMKIATCYNVTHNTKTGGNERPVSIMCPNQLEIHRKPEEQLSNSMQHNMIIIDKCVGRGGRERKSSLRCLLVARQLKNDQINLHNEFWREVT